MEEKVWLSVEQLRKETKEQKDFIEKLNEVATKTAQTCKVIVDDNQKED